MKKNNKVETMVGFNTWKKGTIIDTKVKNNKKLYLIKLESGSEVWNYEKDIRTI